ncbi:MAG: Na/Pi cotransporter family protein [Planctomycetes bacterium]|nr:Na/Pi cotransporter family protein [Planctomycetota bacterium]MBU1518359.1 Na/Pi cotransporter family protein [Planctomycetota bacterium]MBU2457252.1 Na/Pi cotransporter family protein [Planctomycetota bacterium]MBU2596795.1 Na/Pi cotransporter family protein [Planctomycetota bacterium]
MDSSTMIEMIFGIVGGLGIFLLGMKNVSEGMQAVAGDKLRKLINAVTNNRFLACGIGTLVTAIIQSSSVTTVIVVGLVNAGLMNLMQAIGVILGANIGTTITAWILVIKISAYGLPLLGISAIFYLFTKKDKIRYLAMALMGLGMVFFGLELMKNGFAPLKEMPGFEAWFSRFSPTSYFGVIKCVLAGALLTGVVQSSSATIGITMGLAFNGIIDYPTAAALVMGENIGTTVTALLASLGTSTNAKRAALAHTCFNVLGVLWITPIFFPYTQTIQAIIHWQSGLAASTPVVTDGVTTYPHIMAAIAITHTVFNVCNTIIFLPFVRPLANLLSRLVPEKAIPEKPRLTALDIRLFDAPALAIEQSKREILIMGSAVMEMMKTLKEVISSPDEQKEKTEQIFQKEDYLDLMQKEIIEFISAIISGNIPHDVAEESRRHLRMADELESISDYIANILKLNLKLRQTGQKMTPEGLAAIIDLHNNAAEYIELINKATKNEDSSVLATAETEGKTITELMKKYRTEHLARVSSGEASPLKSLIFTDMLNSYRRIKDHGLNIAEVLGGEK